MEIPQNFHWNLGDHKLEEIVKKSKGFEAEKFDCRHLFMQIYLGSFRRMFGLTRHRICVFEKSNPWRCFSAISISERLVGRTHTEPGCSWTCTRCRVHWFPFKRRKYNFFQYLFLTFFLLENFHLTIRYWIIDRLSPNTDRFVSIGRWSGCHRFPISRGWSPFERSAGHGHVAWTNGWQRSGVGEWRFILKQCGNEQYIKAAVY